jgi:hypothetical protein
MSAEESRGLQGMRGPDRINSFDVDIRCAGDIHPPVGSDRVNMPDV